MRLKFQVHKLSFFFLPSVSRCRYYCIICKTVKAYKTIQTFVWPCKKACKPLKKIRMYELRLFISKLSPKSYAF